MPAPGKKTRPFDYAKPKLTLLPPPVKESPALEFTASGGTLGLSWLQRPYHDTSADRLRFQIVYPSANALRTSDTMNSHLESGHWIIGAPQASAVIAG